MSLLLNKENLDFSLCWHEFVEPPFVFVSEEEKTKALPELRQAFEVAAARASICLLINLWSQLSPLYQAHGYMAWIPSCILAT